MKTRALFFALVVGVVSMTSGCHCFRCMFPNAGWRFHEGWFRHGNGNGNGNGCATCPPVGGPIAFRPPIVVPGGHDGVGCNGGIPSGHQPVGYPPIAYPPVIGNPMPIPGGPNVIPGGELPHPMPNKKTGQ